MAPGYPISIPATCLGQPKRLQGLLGPGIPRGTLSKKPSPASHCFLLGTKAALNVCVWSLKQGAVPRGVVLINPWPRTKSSAGLAALRNGAKHSIYSLYSAVASTATRRDTSKLRTLTLIYIGGIPCSPNTSALCTRLSQGSAQPGAMVLPSRGILSHH